MSSTYPEMDNMYREAADLPGECNPKDAQHEISLCMKNQLREFYDEDMNILLTSSAPLVLLSSSLDNSENSLVKKMSSGITGIYRLHRWNYS